MKFKCNQCPNLGYADSIAEILKLKKLCPDCIRKSLRRISNKERKKIRIKERL